MAYIGPPPSQKLATPTSQYFSGNGSTTSFTLNRPVNVAEDLNVFVNNVPQEPGSGKSYTATGTTLTFDAAPASGTNNVYVVYRGLAEPTTRLEHPSGQPLAATTGTFSGAVSGTTGTFSGNVGVGAASDTGENHLQFTNNAVTAFVGVEGSSGNRFLGSATNNAFFGTTGADGLELATNNNVRMVVDSSGNVGIGTNSPTATFRTSIKGDYSSIIGGIEFDSGGGDKFTIGHATATSPSGTINVVGAGNLIMKTNNAERMRIDSSGNTTFFNTFSATAANGSFVYLGASGSVNVGVDTTGSRAVMGFRNPNGEIGQITTSGSTTAFTSLSDYRLKTAVTYDWDATTRLKQLKPARFKWIADGDDAVEVDGFLAHEAQAIVPESVTGTKDEVEVWKDGEELPDGISVGDNKLDEDGNTIPVMQGIDQAKLVPLLCKTILELEARITALESE